MSIGISTVLFVLVFLASILFTMIGLGGGIFYIPLQVWLGIEYHQAAVTSLVLVLINSISGSVTYYKNRKISWQLVIIAGSTIFIGGLIGGKCAGQLSGAMLSVIFGVLVFVAALLMLKPLRNQPQAATEPGPRIWSIKFGDSIIAINPIKLTLLTLIIGFLSNLVGLGGGVLLVPLIVLMFAIPMDYAVGTSTFLVGISAIAGLLGQAYDNNFNFNLTVILGVAVIVGSQIGARISVTIERDKLKRIFGYTAIVIAGLMLIRGLS